MERGTPTTDFRRARERLGAYRRAGRATLVPGDSVREDVLRLKEDAGIRSNDAHVLALARASRARLLYTGDNKLEADFKNDQIISGPRRKIYSRRGSGLSERQRLSDVGVPPSGHEGVAARARSFFKLWVTDSVVSSTPARNGSVT